MQFRAAARSDLGRRRAANEDTYALAPELGLFLVADGMGGHRAGQVASGLAARAASAKVKPAGPFSEMRSRAALISASRRFP